MLSFCTIFSTAAAVALRAMGSKDASRDASRAASWEASAASAASSWRASGSVMPLVPVNLCSDRDANAARSTSVRSVGVRVVCLGWHLKKPRASVLAKDKQARNTPQASYGILGARHLTRPSFLSSAGIGARGRKGSPPIPSHQISSSVVQSLILSSAEQVVCVSLLLEFMPSSCCTLKRLSRPQESASAPARTGYCWHRCARS